MLNKYNRIRKQKTKTHMTRPIGANNLGGVRQVSHFDCNDELDISNIDSCANLDSHHLPNPLFYLRSFALHVSDWNSLDLAILEQVFSSSITPPFT